VNLTPLDKIRATAVTGSHVLASVTSGLEEFIRTNGGDPHRVLARAGLDMGLADQPTSPIPMRDFCNVLDGAVEATGNERFGLWFGHQFRPEAMGLLGYLAVSSATLGAALSSIERAFPVHQSDSMFRVSVTGGICRIDYQLRDGSILNRRQDAELSLGMFCNILRQPMGGRWAPLEVHFEHARPLGTEEYRRAFACDLRFDQPMNAILLRAEALERPMPNSDPILHAVLTQMLAGITPRTAASGIISAVRNEIVDLLRAGYPRLEDVSARLALPSWTLQRRLGQEGCRFKDLVDEVRRELSLVLLAEASLSVSELAFRLGYSEVSAFSRAFQRWHGLSPRDWRKRAGAAQIGAEAVLH